MSNFAVEPLNDVQEFTDFGSDINLIAAGGGVPARYFKVLDTNPGRDLVFTIAGGTTRTLLVSEDEEIIVWALTITSATNIKRLRVGW